MAIGTAVKKVREVTTINPNLPPQAIIQDRETFIESFGGGTLDLVKGGASSARRMQQGPMAIIFAIFIVLFYIFKFVMMR